MLEKEDLEQNFNLHIEQNEVEKEKELESFNSDDASFNSSFNLYFKESNKKNKSNNKNNNNFLNSSFSKDPHENQDNDYYLNIINRNRSSSKPSSLFRKMEMSPSPRKFSDDNNQEYLDILSRRSFKGIQTYFKQKKSTNVKFKESYKKFSSSDSDNYTKKNKERKKSEYDYPVNIFRELFFSWTVKLLRTAQRYGQLKITHLGKFDPCLSPDQFLEEIKPQWEKYSKQYKNLLKKEINKNKEKNKDKDKNQDNNLKDNNNNINTSNKNINIYNNDNSYTNNPLLKSLLSANFLALIFVFIVSLIISFFDFSTVIMFREVLLHFDTSNKESKSRFPLLSSIVILLFIKLFHIFLRRFFESYTLRFGTKLTIQINTLIYDKLLKISPYAPISEGDLVNFIQIDAEKFGEFFSYTPATFVLPLQIIFSIYLLFKYFGLTFIFGFISLIIILVMFFLIQKMRNKYQKELLNEKNNRMRTTSQVLDLMKIIKMNSWENYFYEKIKSQRDIELNYLRKIEHLTLFVNSLFWCTGNITSLVSILAYSFFNEQMDISNILTSLYIFNNLGEPLFLLPEYITGLGDSLISLRRLETFLFSKEYNESQVVNDDTDSQYAIFINDLDFGINEDEDYYLNTSNSNINKEGTDNNNNNFYSENLLTNVNTKKKLEDYFNEGKELENIIDLGGSFKQSGAGISENYINTMPKNHLNESFGYSTNKRLKKTKENNPIKSSFNNNHNNYASGYLNTDGNYIKTSKKNVLSSSADNLDLEQKHAMTEESYTFNSSSFNMEMMNFKVPLLRGISLKVEHGDLIGIAGEVGSGKTCLLNAILNNLDILNFNYYNNNENMYNENNNNNYITKFFVNGKISYSPQTPWIFNDTVKGNILFNKEYDEERYNHIIKICQLDKEIKKLEGGDFAEIGERGMKLSTGLKVRISLARALYANSDIYLFDDPLSLLDTSIGREIFNKVIKGYLKSKTVLITTHNLQYLPMMKKVIYMKKGRIDFFGTAEEAVNQPFFRRYVNFQNNRKLSEDNTDTISAIRENIRENDSLAASDNIYMSDFDSKTKIQVLKSFNKKKYLYGNSSINSGINNPLLRYSFDKKNIYNKMKRKKIEKNKESRKEDNSGIPNIKGIRLILNYSGGEFFIILVILINILWKFCESGSDYIITTWSVESQNNKRVNIVYLVIYSIISIFGILFVFFRTYAIIKGIIKYNKHMHNTLLQRLFNAPINLFYDLVPHSHIENRLSKDLENSIHFFWAINSGSRLFFQLLSCLIVAVLFNYFCILLFPLMITLDYYIFNFYIKGGRALNYLETITRAPITTKFTETLNGITSIRGFRFEEEFRKTYHQKLYDFYRVLIYQSGTSSFFALNIDLVSFCLLFFILTFSWLFEKLVNPLAVGLLMSYTLKMIENTYGFFEQYTLFERMYSSMDSCEAYTKVVQEKPKHTKIDAILRRKNFPKKGKIQFINYYTKYRPDTKFILGRINLLINPGEKIGIIGKSGSGKSTLLLGLLRIIEPMSGKILIDDVDISQIGLDLLRQSISVIPQDPKLSDGTLRENIDPLDNFSDEEICDQLELLGLSYLYENNDGLDMTIGGGGKNLSVGERQLICITRALLRKSKIIVMDEATSSIDYKTESLIQNSLIHSFKDNTLITIAAQKVKSVMNYDRIYVLDSGKIVDCGTPQELIDKKSKIFSQLYQQSLIMS